MKLNDLMQDFQQYMEFDSLPRDDDGMYFFEVDDEVKVKLFEIEETGEMILLCSLMRLSDEQVTAPLMKILLGANYRWALTAGGSYGIDPVTNTVEYCLRQPLGGMDAARLAAFFENVIAALQTMLRGLLLHLAQGSREGEFLEGNPSTEEYLRA